MGKQFNFLNQKAAPKGNTSYHNVLKVKRKAQLRTMAATNVSYLHRFALIC